MIFFDSLKQDLEIVEKSRIFTLRVTIWLMIMQRLSSTGTLAAAVSDLILGCGKDLLEPCKRVLEWKISASTGAYSQARQRLPEQAARRVAERTFEQLRAMAPRIGLRDRLFLLDGSSVRLASSPAVLKAYPAAENQTGPTHWPVARIAVAHHVVTGLAMAPYFGPMYGPNAVSEQALSAELIDRLPADSVLIADRNFGVFSVVWRAHSGGHQVLVRMTTPRANCLKHCPEDLKAGTAIRVVWEPTAATRRAHPGLPADARIEGTLITAKPDGAAETLYLFTTLPVPPAEVVLLYKERWNIETDLRSLKGQVRLETLTAKSPLLVATELLMAVASYNIVRAIIGKVAQQAGMDPRRISFSRSRELFSAFTTTAANLTSEEDFNRLWKVLLRGIAQCKLPKRNRPPQKREVWHKPQPFPFRKMPTIEKNKN